MHSPSRLVGCRAVRRLRRGKPPVSFRGARLLRAANGRLRLSVRRDPVNCCYRKAAERGVAVVGACISQRQFVRWMGGAVSRVLSAGTERRNEVRFCRCAGCRSDGVVLPGGIRAGRQSVAGAAFLFDSAKNRRQLRFAAVQTGACSLKLGIRVAIVPLGGAIRAME